MNHAPFSFEVPGARVCVLMVHGFLDSPHYFDALLSHIPADWSFYSLLLDGHGQTLHELQHSNRAKWEAQVEQALARACELYERVVIIAHSMGCLLTANAAVRCGLEHKISSMLFLGAALYPKCEPPIVHTAWRLISCQDPQYDDRRTVAARTCCSVDVQHIRARDILASIPRLADVCALARYTRKRIGSYDLPMIALQSYKDEMVGRRSIKPFEKNPHATCEFLPGSCHFYYTPEDTERICCVFEGVVADVRKNLQKVYAAH